MQKVYVIAAAMSTFGFFPEIDIVEPARRTAWEAIKSSGVPPKMIGTIFCANMRQGGTLGQRVFSRLGLTGGTIINVENACASGGSAVYLARNEVASGACDVAVVLGAEKLTDIKGFLPTNTSDYNGMNGQVMPASYAMVVRAHMEKYGTTAEQTAMVSVKNHRYGGLNPRAQFKKPVTGIDAGACSMQILIR